MLQKFTFSSNALKILAAITMLIDHIGVILLPNVEILRIIGRISFPIFSFLICEGCRYTKNKLLYFLRIFLLGIATSSVYFFESKKIYFNVLITFSFSILLIFILQMLKKEEKLKRKTPFIFLFGGTAFALFIITKNVTVDYGFWGVMLPVFPAIVNIFSEDNNSVLFFQKRFYAFIIGLLILCFYSENLQFYSLISLIPLSLYNGKIGFKLPKYFFYIFYPVHIAIIWLVGIMM